MLKETVIAMKNLFATNGQTVIIIGDNGKYINTKTSFVKWDDTNGKVIVIKANTDAASQIVAPMEITVMEYETIQYLQGLFDLSDKFSTALTALGLSADEVDKIIRFTEGLNNFTTVYNKAEDPNQTNPFHQYGEINPGTIIPATVPAEG